MQRGLSTENILTLSLYQKVLQLHKVSPVIVNFLKISMKSCKINLHLNHTQTYTVCEELKVECGIFQVDLLSPLFSVWPWCLFLRSSIKLVTGTRYMN